MKRRAFVMTKDNYLTLDWNEFTETGNNLCFAVSVSESLNREMETIEDAGQATNLALLLNDMLVKLMKNYDEMADTVKDG